MTILPLTNLIQMALSFYLISLSIEDVIYATIDGEDIPGAPVARNIEAAVDPSNNRQLERIFGGSVSDGDIGIYTAETLYVQDQGGLTQSYATYQGQVYRIVQEADWIQQAGVYVYLGRRHVTQD